MDKNLKNKLQGEQLSSVEFIQDYLQLHFDGRVITFYVWPKVYILGIEYIFGDPEYRNRICELISKSVKDVIIKENVELLILFNNKDCKISLDLNKDNKEIISEIAIFNDELDNSWEIFD